MPAQCSRAGCRSAAEWNVNWRNPALHTADRVKVWRACSDHRVFLRDYLRSRGFPVMVTGVDEQPLSVPDSDPAAMTGADS